MSTRRPSAPDPDPEGSPGSPERASHPISRRTPDGARRRTPIELGGDMPRAAGAYSRAVEAGGLLFVSGQVPRDFRTGELAGDSVESQTRAVLDNLRAVLEAAGAGLEDVVSMTVYLQNVNDWDAFNAIYRDTMPAPYPSRTVVGAGLRGIRVELSAIAVAPRRP